MAEGWVRKQEIQQNSSQLLVRRRLHFLQRNAVGYWVVRNGNEKYLAVVWILSWCCWSGPGGWSRPPDQTS